MDIDKAYIMGQSFSEDGIYIGWSSLFNYSSDQMIDASKTLPLPRDIELVVAEGEEYSIENELNDIIASDGPQRLRKLANLIYKIDANKGRYNYLTGANAEEKRKIIQLIRKHEKYKVNYKLRNLAYKNVASSNIRSIVHDIRNRDQAYSPITMKDLQEEADNSPKGAKTKLLNMINPLTKYIMLNLNLVGKNVIGIAANGEKDWFNLTYYYHNILRTGNKHDKFFLKMNHSYSRLSGRATNQLMTIIVKHIPDLWNADEALAKKIKEEFYSTVNEPINLDDKYVDSLISELLSAATDNAKELILAKINAGSDLAKYYLHLLMMGFNIKDVVSFMTSPVVELIDKYSRNDLYINESGSVKKAISILNGDIDISKLIVNPKQKISLDDLMEIAQAEVERAEAEAEAIEEAVSSGLILRIKDTNYSWIILKIGPMYNTVNATSLKDFVLKYIKAKTKPLSKSDPEYMLQLSEYNFPITDNMNTNYVFKYINLVVTDINQAIIDYNETHIGNYSKLDFELDLNEFLRITDEANETSTLASTWLKLNQGIPQTDIELIKLIRKMNSTVSRREHKMGIKKPKDSKKVLFIKLSEEEIPENEGTKNELLAHLSNCRENNNVLNGTTQALKQLSKVIRNIQTNNPELTLNEIISVLLDAINADLYGNFDLYKFTNDDKVVVPQTSTMIYNTRNGDLVSYRELAATYYNLIKSSWNILDIVNRIPHYKRNIDLLNYTLQQRHLFAGKAKLIDELISLGDLAYNQLSDKDYKRIIEYADKILIASYFFSKTEPIDISNIENAKVYDRNYTLVKSDELYINSINGIDSLRRFVENEFYEWLKNNYSDNFLVKELVQSSNFGLSLLKTALNLFDVDQSLQNKLTYNRYLLGILELAEESFDKNYKVADILMLYNLAINGTKLGGKYLTGIFRDLVLIGRVLYDYYNFISKQDYSNDFKYMQPTKKDFLIAIAPTVYSTYAIEARTEPYVKLVNPNHGYNIYKRHYDLKSRTWKYDITKPESLLQIDDLGLTPELIDERIYNFAYNSLMMFPELHLKLKENSIFSLEEEANTEEMANVLAKYIRLNRLLIYKIC